jgi:hypothetical protein
MAAVMGLGCGEPDPIPFVLQFTVKADEKAPIAGARLSARARALGATNAGGELTARVAGFEGDRLPVTLECPEGYAATPAESVIILRSIQGLDGAERQPITVDLGCQPTKRDTVVLVQVAGEARSLPIKIDGAVVGQTDALGFAHVHLSTNPGSRFEVSLDTTSNEKLMPQNHPKQAFSTEQRDDFFVFSQTFKLPPKPKPPRKRSAPKPHIPQRLN